MSLHAKRSVNRHLFVVLVLTAATVPTAGMFAQDSSVRSVHTSERTEAEPDLSITFQLQNQTQVDGPIFLHQKKNSEYPGLTKLLLTVVYGTDVLHDENNKPEVKFDPQRLTANLMENGDQRGLLTLELPEGNNSEEVVEVVLRVSGRNGRSNSRKLQVFLNAGALVGQIIPDSLAADSATDGPRIENLAFLGNRFEGSVLFIDEDASGEWETGEPTTVVDANNEFRFPKSKAFFREHLIRPRVLWVDGNKVEADFHDHLVDPRKAWFKISAIENDEGGEPQPEDSDEEENNGGEPIDEGPDDGDDDDHNGEGETEAEDVEEKAIRVTWNSTAMPPDGKSWNTAFNSLQQALEAAAAPNAQTREIWVAQGVYLPPDKSGFQIGPNASIYGGFLGNESKRAERPRIRRGTTILSGDLGKNDGHFAPITSVDVTPDAKLVATASEDRTVKLWELDGDTYKLKHTLTGHLQGVNSVSISADGKKVVSGGDDMTVRLWSVETGQLIAAIAPDPEDQIGHTASVRAVDFSPNISRIASASSDGTVRIWDASTRALTKRLNGHTGEVTSVAYLDDTTVASGSVDRTVRVWNISSDNSPQVLAGHTGPVSSLAVTRDDDTVRIVSGSEDSTIRVWKKDRFANEAAEFRSHHRLLGDRYDMQLVSVAAPEDIQAGRALAVLAQIGTGDKVHLRLFDGRGEAVIDEELEAETVTAVRKALAASWQVPVDQVKPEWATHTFSILDLAAVSFELDDQFMQHPLFGDDFGPVFGVALSNDGRTIIASHAAKYKPELGNTLSFWNVETGQLDHAHKIGTDVSLSSISIAPAAEQSAHNYRIFRGQADGSIAIWDRATLSQKFSASQITCAAVSRDGTKSAYGTNDGHVEVMSSDGMSLLSINHGSRISSIALSDDGAKLAFGSDKKLYLADAAMGAAPAEADAHDKIVTSIAFSSDSERIATGGDDALIKVWNSKDTSSLVPVHTFGGHLSAVTCVGIVGTGDNCKVISGSEDRTLKVWDLSDEKLLNTIEHQSAVTDCAITETTPAEPRFVVSADRVELAPVRLKTTGNIALSGHQLIDGEMTDNDDRVLVASQDTGSENGIYVYVADTDTWVRASDADEPQEFVVEKIVLVEEGNTFRGRRATYGGPASPGLGVDNLIFANDFLPARLKADVNVELNGLQDIDGVMTAPNDRILLTGQTNPAQNGIYKIELAAGGEIVWKRAADANTPDAFSPRRVVSIQEGQRFGETLETYAGGAHPKVGQDPILFVPRVDKPVVHLWQWRLSNEDVPTVTRLADLSSAKVVTDVAITNDSQTILTGSGDGSISIWETDADRKFRVVKTIPAHDDGLLAIGVVGSGIRFASASESALRVWESRLLEAAETPIAGFALGGDSQTDNTHAVVVLPPGNNDITLDGLVIKGGVAPGGMSGGMPSPENGGGLRTDNNQRINIVDCIIEGNAAKNGGGGVHVAANSEVTLARCSFVGNSAQTSGGAVATLGKAALDSCVFHANRAVSNEGGAVAFDGGSLAVQQCIISECNDKGSALSAKFNLTILNSTIVGNGRTPVFSLTDGAELTLQNTILARDISETTRKLVETSKNNLLQTNLAKSPTLIAQNYFYSEENDLPSWKPDTPVKVFDVIRPVDGPAGLVMLCIEPTDSTTTGAAPPEWPTEVNKTVEEVVGDKKIVWRSVFDLVTAPLFDELGDQGGLHETVPLASDSIARDIGGDDSGLEWDQRGENYSRRYGPRDIGAFEWQPLPASHSDVYEYDNSKTDFDALGDPLVDAPLLNDGAPRINSTLTISKDALASANPSIQFQQVRLVATDDLGQPLQGEQTIDGLFATNGDRVLVVRQGGGEASPKNGIYIVGDGEWQRAGDANESREMPAYKTIFVAGGDHHANSTWTLTHSAADSIPVLGTTDLKFDDGSTPTTYGQVKWSDDQLHYRLKKQFHNTHFLGRDEINYVNRFGGLVSPPAQVTVWTVGPLQSVDEENVHRFVVNTTADHVIPESGSINFNEGGLTLREAMLLAEQTDGNDEIHFAKDVFAEPSVIELVEPLVFGSEAKGTLNIVGPGAEKLIIRAGNGETPGHRGLEVSSVRTKSPRITISRVSFRACDSQRAPGAQGGAVHIAGDSNVNIEFVAFVGNKAEDGAAIFSGQQNVTVSQCTFTENDSLGAEGRTVSLPVPNKVTASVFWSNRLKGEPNPNDKSIDGETNRNFYEEPRFVKTQAAPSVMELDIRLRRDSLAFHHGADPWTANTPVRMGALVRPGTDDETVVFECVDPGTGTTHSIPPDNWPAAIGELVTELTTGVVWKRVEENLRTFRFLGAYPKFPNDSDVPFGSTGNGDGDTLFVDRWVRTPGDGGSWKSAMPSLHDAIEKAAADYRVTTIKIAGDENALEFYKPERPYTVTTPGDANSPNADWTFILQHGLKLEGGYRSARTFATDVDDKRDENLVSDPASFRTILSGKLPSDLNSKHVLSAYGVQGFHVSRLTVKNEGGSEPGGGLFVPEQPQRAIGKVSGVLFRSNTGSAGGAIYLEEGILEIGQSSFRDNKATLDGGAISVVTDRAKLSVSNTTFANNSSKNGGAIHVASGRISMDHVTIVRNEATGDGGFAGLFVEGGDRDDVKITNSIFCENINAEISKNTNLSLLSPNVVNAEEVWEHSLLAEWKYNEFQTEAGTKTNGPTPTIAILPQIPYRMGQSTQRVTEASVPRAPESATDQRGAPGTSLSRSDAGAFERQYFIHEKSMTRFFIADDFQTNENLWAEVVNRDGAVEWQPGKDVKVNDLVYPADSDLTLVFRCTTMGTTGTTPPEWPQQVGAKVNDNTVEWEADEATTAYIQVSQHLKSDTLEDILVRNVKDDSVDFGSDSVHFTAKRDLSGFVQRASVFPSRDALASGSDNEMGELEYQGKSEISIKIEHDAGTPKLILEDRKSDAQARLWTVTWIKSDGATGRTTGEGSSLEVNSEQERASYVVRLRRGESDVPPITFDFVPPESP